MYIPSRPYYTINASLLTGHGMHEVDGAGIKLNILFHKESEFTPHLYKTLSLLKSEYIVSLSGSLIQDDIPPDLFAKLYLVLMLNNFSERQKILPVFSQVKQDTYALHIDKFQTYL